MKYFLAIIPEKSWENVLGFWEKDKQLRQTGLCIVRRRWRSLPLFTTDKECCDWKFRGASITLAFLYGEKRGDCLYYVIQVAPGMEDRTEALIRGKVNQKVYGRCFHPIRHIRKKFQGQWKDLHEKLLPGYVFISSDFVHELYMELQQVPVLTKLLGKNEELFVSLHDEETQWLEKLISLEESEDECVEVGLSQVLAEDDQIIVLSGPLKNMEGRIKKINLHRRIAEVEVEFMNRKTVLFLGIEMVAKEGSRKWDLRENISCFNGKGEF